MKKNLFVIVLLLAFFGCNKDEETPDIKHSIIGQLTAGENVTSNDFSEMEVTLGKLNSAIDISNYDRDNLEFDTLIYAPVNASGGVLFENLEEGNYLAIMSDKYVFNTDTIWSCSIDETTSTVEMNKTVDRMQEENGNENYEIKIYRDIGDYKIQTLYFYYDNQLYRTIDVSSLNLGGIFSNYATIEIELDLDKNLTFNAIIKNYRSGNTYTLDKKAFNKDYDSAKSKMEADGEGVIGIEINKYWKYRIKIYSVVPHVTYL